MSSIENNEALIGGLEKTEATQLPNFPSVPLEYMNVTGKQGELVNRDIPENVKLQTGKITIKFSEPIWVYDITLWIAEHDQAKSDKLSRHATATIKYARGGEREITMSAYENYVDCFSRDFLTEIEIKFHGINKLTLATPPVCKKITITGFCTEDYVEFCRNVGSYVLASKSFSEGKEKLIADLRATNQKISEAHESLATTLEEVEAAKESHVEESETLNSILLEISKSEAKLSVLNSKSSELDQRINENSRSNENLSKSIQDNRESLDRLLANKNVFMEEFSSYVEQGRGNIRYYLLIGIALFVVLGICLWRLIESSLKLAEDPLILKTVSAFDLFLSRLPLAFVLGSVILVCIRIIYTLLNKIFEIHQERLLLSKLSILAKDNSFSSAEGLDVPANLMYDKRVSLKMELLKEFLSGNYRGAAEKEKAMRERFNQFKEGFRRKDEPKQEQDESAPSDEGET